MYGNLWLDMEQVREFAQIHAPRELCRQHTCADILLNLIFKVASFHANSAGFVAARAEFGSSKSAKISR